MIAEGKPRVVGTLRLKKEPSTGAPSAPVAGQKKEKQPKVHILNVSQMHSICTEVAQSFDGQHREQFQAELSKRDDDIALIHADIESLEKTVRDSVTQMRATTKDGIKAAKD